MLLVLFIVAGDWVVIRSDGDNLIERRLRADGLMEMRGTTYTDVPAAAIAEAFWNPKRKPLEQVKKRLVLMQDDKQKIVYHQLHVPLVKDRDYTVRMERMADPKNALYQFTSRCESSAGPPENDEHVRVKDCLSITTMEGQPDGRTLLTYEGHANPAGSLPRWIINMIAPRAASQVLDRLIAEGREVQVAKAP